MNEVKLSTVTAIVPYAIVAPATLLMIPLLFLVAGLLTPGGRWTARDQDLRKDRLLRLGAPFAAYVLLLQFDQLHRHRRRVVLAVTAVVASFALPW